MKDWDYEHEGEEIYGPPALTPLFVFWCDLKILAVCAFLIILWALLLGAQSVEAEMGFAWQPQGKPIRERHYRLNLPGWLC